jgi:hypothetical protein
MGLIRGRNRRGKPLDILSYLEKILKECTCRKRGLFAFSE